MHTSNLCMATNETNSHHCDVEEQRDSSIGIYSMFIIGQILLGIGASPSFTLGLTYIDENCKPKLTSFYISWTFCISAIGVAVGYIMGGQALSLFADIDKISSSSVLLTPKDPQWVGAWWIGTLFGGAVFIFVALPFIGYPKRLPGYKELKKLRKSEAHAGSDETIAKQKHFGKSIKDFPKALLILITNPTYLLINLGASAEALMIGGYATFGAKILQERFSTSLTNAGIIMGIVTIPGSGGGMMLKCRGIIRLCVCFMSVSLLLAPSFLTYCTRPPIVGIFVAYNGTSIGSLTASCNEDCRCNTGSYEPVCIENKMVFFTPCHAGCRNVAEEKGAKIYHSCSCLGTSVSGNDTVKEVADGICTKDCVWLYVYCVLMLLIMVASFATMSPGTTAALRCVPDSQRSMALGVSLLIVRLLGTTPGPILLGFVLDSTCKVWDEKCDGGRGSCWVYDTEDMSIRLMIWWITIKALGITFFLLASFVYRAPKESSHNENPTVEIPDPIGSISMTLDASGKTNTAFTKL
ncbi:hypothetical protein ACJMK2_036294 [Sinanodonta woodiana]|uniref:Solute carrier organic anion transporter family member n=1 Tax=Sinanodonta woodiana TaxID=1069815 RepID=A0ABD3WGS3_SINWO